MWYLALSPIAGAGVRAAQYVHIDKLTGTVTTHAFVPNAAAVTAALLAGQLLRLPTAPSGPPSPTFLRQPAGTAHEPSGACRPRAARDRPLSLLP